MYFISEYKKEITQNNCSNSILTKLILENSSDIKIKSHISLLKKIIRSCNKTLPHEEEEEVIIDFLIDYFKNTNKGIFFTQNNLKKTFSKLVDYLENESKYLYYFSPLYNFKSDIELLVINESLKIRNISTLEKEKLTQIYQSITHVIGNLNKVTHVVVVRIEKDNKKNKEPKTIAENEILDLRNLLKIFKDGDLMAGGLYAMGFSENWNPRKQIDKIEFEPFKTWRKNKFLLDDDRQFRKFYQKVQKCFPHVRDRTFFDVAIRRFGNASTQKNKLDEITDYVVVLESLLVPDGKEGGATAKLQHRAATILGKSDKEILEIFELMAVAYNVRSGMVHGDADRPLTINGKVVAPGVAAKRIEDLARSAIKKMIIYAQIPDNVEKPHASLTKQIHSMIYDRDSLKKFRKITTLD